MEVFPGRASQTDRWSLDEIAFTDWLACACAGRDSRAAAAVRSCGDDLLTSVAFAGTAGHVLDYDDTFSEGVAHVSATCAPASLVLAAGLGRSLGEMLTAYDEAFEAMAEVAEASHPALYDAGWHPTSVCGSVGAAVAAARLLALSPVERENALAIAVLRAGGTRGAFGSDGKAIQVGQAAAAGVQAALLARGGAIVDRRAIHGPLGFTGVLGAGWPFGAGDGGDRDHDGIGDRARLATGGVGPLAIERNWIKLHPSCLGTHAPIDAAVQTRESGYRMGDERIEVRVHPVARQAAHLDAVGDGLSAKFSIPYCVAHTLLSRPPRVRDFTVLDAETAERAALVEVGVDDSLPPFGAVLIVRGVELARVPCPRGAPDRPATASQLAEKVTELAGDRLAGVFADLDAPAALAIDAAQLACR
jgi:2-methylcitrate dehydratase PrpD